jgi:hypothetical protein
VRDQVDAVALALAPASATPPAAVGVPGRLHYSTASGAISYGDGVAWRQLDSPAELEQVLGTPGAPQLLDGWQMTADPLRFWRRGSWLHFAGQMLRTADLNTPAFVLVPGFRPPLSTWVVVQVRTGSAVTTGYVQIDRWGMVRSTAVPSRVVDFTGVALEIVR